jgi:hypothetical protein
MTAFDLREALRRSFKHLAEARDAIDQTRAAVATSRLVIERSRKHKAGPVRIAEKGGEPEAATGAALSDVH